MTLSHRIRGLRFRRGEEEEEHPGGRTFETFEVRIPSVMDQWSRSLTQGPVLCDYFTLSHSSRAWVMSTDIKTSIGVDQGCRTCAVHLKEVLSSHSGREFSIAASRTEVVSLPWLYRCDLPFLVIFFNLSSLSFDK
jgi:hypothetical protein